MNYNLATIGKQDIIINVLKDLNNNTQSSGGTQDAIVAALNTLNQSINTNGIQLKIFSVELTRPANVTPYTAGDLVGDVVNLTKLFQNVSKAIGTGVKIYRVRVQTNDTGVLAGSKFNLHFYQDTPDLTGLTDNGAFVINYTNAIKRAGKIPVIMDSSVGNNDYNVVGLNPVGRDVTVMLETVSGFTPSANSTKFTLVIDCELSNN